MLIFNFISSDFWNQNPNSIVDILKNYVIVDWQSVRWFLLNRSMLSFRFFEFQIRIVAGKGFAYMYILIWIRFWRIVSVYACVGGYCGPRSPFNFIFVLWSCLTPWTDFQSTIRIFTWNFLCKGQRLFKKILLKLKSDVYIIQKNIKKIKNGKRGILIQNIRFPPCVKEITSAKSFYFILQGCLLFYLGN